MLSKQIAENAAFEAFLNSYIREINRGEWFARNEWLLKNKPSALISGEEILQLFLPLQEKVFAVSVSYKSLTGCSRFASVFQYDCKEEVWHQSNKLCVIVSLIQELQLGQSGEDLQGSRGEAYSDLLSRVLDSSRCIEKYVEQREKDAFRLYSPKASFIETEQSLLFGHWMHPSPKSRQGMADWQQERFAPELQGSFQLHFFLAENSSVKEVSLLQGRPTSWFQENMGSACPSGYCAVPVHPLQAQWLLQQEYVKNALREGTLINIGPQGREFFPTSSVRTVYAEDKDFMLKFSIPVKLTNSLRNNKLSECYAGLAMTKLRKKIPFLSSHPSFKMMDDPAFLTIMFPGMKESGFEVIIRENPFRHSHVNSVCCVAALVQQPLPGHKSRLYQTVQLLAEKRHLSLKEAGMLWFQSYFDRCVKPLLELYDCWGIALEAHQQNSVIECRDYLPHTFYYRDNQGYYLSERCRNKLVAMEPSLAELQELFYNESVIKERFSYYLFFNQIFSILHRLGAEDVIEEEVLISWLQCRLDKLSTVLKASGKDVVAYVLNQPKLRVKANLLTSFYEIDELEAELEQAVYREVNNPLYRNEKEALLHEKKHLLSSREQGAQTAG
nr:IucA/IucC family protein [Metabacillus lacus]